MPHSDKENESDEADALLREFIHVIKHLTQTLSNFMPTLDDLATAVDANTQAVKALPDRVAAAITAAGKGAEVPQSVIDQINANTSAVAAVAPTSTP